MKREENKKAFLAAFPHTIPVLTGFSMLGIAFGILMRTSGYGTALTVAMSLLVFAGSLQYVALTLLTSAFNPLYAFTLTLLVNARHLFYGLSLLEKFKDTSPYKPYLIFGLCDETFSILCAAEIPQDVEKKRFMFFVTLLNHSYWVIGSVTGSLIGQWIHFNTHGLDFVLTALFTVIFVNQWDQRKNRLPALTGLVVTSLSLLIFGAEQFILPAMGLLLLVLALIKKPLEKEPLP